MITMPSMEKCPNCGCCAEYRERSDKKWELVCMAKSTCAWKRIADEITVVDMGVRIDCNKIHAEVKAKMVAEWQRVYDTADRYMDDFLMEYARRNIAMIIEAKPDFNFKFNSLIGMPE